MKKVFITDTDSMLGQAIIKTLSLNSEIELFGFGRKNKIVNNLYNINIKNNKELKSLLYEIKPDYIINNFVTFDINKAEENKNETMAINAGFAEQLARISSVIECRLIAFSDYNVFSNPDKIYEEADKQNPANYLGKTFLSMENSIKLAEIDFTLFRLGLLMGYSENGKDSNYFYDKIEELKNNRSITIPEGMVQPVFADDIANAVELTIENDITGVFNFAGDEILTYKDLFTKVAEFYKIKDYSILIKKNKIYTKKSELINLKAKTTFSINFTEISDIINFIKFQKD